MRKLPRFPNRYHPIPVDSDGDMTAAKPSESVWGCANAWNGVVQPSSNPRTPWKNMDATTICVDVSDDATRAYEEEYTSIRIDNANDINRLLARHDAVLQQLDALCLRIEGLLVEVASKPAGLLVAQLTCDHPATHN